MSVRFDLLVSKYISEEISAEELEEMERMIRANEGLDIDEWLKKNLPIESDDSQLFDIDKGKKLTLDIIRTVESDFEFPSE